MGQIGLHRIRIISRRELLDQQVAGIDFQHRQACLWQLPGIGEQLLQLSIHPTFRRDQADRAACQPLRHPHVGYGSGERLFGKGNEAIQRARLCLRGRWGTVAQWDEGKIGTALGHRLERFAVKVDTNRGPEIVDLIRKQQHLYAAGAETFQLRGC